MQKSLAKNSIFYLIYNVLNVAFPFFTGIYVSHILLPESIGSVAAAQNLAQYFVILAFLGIPTYGLREISKTRNDKNEKDKVFSELYVINLLSTIIFSCIYIILVLSVSEYRENKGIYLLVGLSIALNAFNIGWLYEGLEEFKFISLRNVLFKAISFVFLVVFVKNETDIFPYALVSIIGTAGNSIINVAFAHRFVKLSLNNLNLRRHMKSIMFLVVVNLSIELYSLVDITMMNFLCEKDIIAFYKYGRSIEAVLLQIVNTFTMVLVPRISFYYNENKYVEYNGLLSKGLAIIFLCAIPMVTGLYFIGDTLMVALYGEPYLYSATVLKVLSILLIISPIGYLLGSRVLLVCGLERLMIYPVSIGAIINILGNSILIPKYEGVGAALASSISEIFVMIIYVFLARKHFCLINVKDSILKTLLSDFAMIAFLYLVREFDLNGWLLIMIQVIGGGLVYVTALIVLNEEIVTEYAGKLFKQITQLISSKRGEK